MMAQDKAYQQAEQLIEKARQEGATELNLSRMGLKEIPESLASLTQLQGLDLNNNELKEIPAVIASLTQLQGLYLNNNELKEIPESIASLTQLLVLYLDSNQIREIPESIASLTQLRILNLQSNQIEEIPESIASLTQLQQLFLSSNQIKEIPESISSLTQLQQLFLSSNRIKEIPAAIASLNQLKELFLANNPLNPELAAAYEQGLDAVMAYLRAKAGQQLILNEAKLILIGEGEVGKSCLLGALRGDEWQENRPTTHGIEIKPVLVKDSANDTEITLNAWDFGGQRIYRPTHQLFFSAPAVYLVVWKPREGVQQGFVQEWITLIKHRAPDAKILVVATHGGPGNRQPDIDKQGILDQFGTDTVLGFFHIDSKPNSDSNYCAGITELKDAIADVAASLPEMGRSIPAKWQKVREKLQTNENAYLPYQEVINICTEEEINEQQAKLFITISHTLGHIIHYDYDPLLRDYVILKPDWLAKAISFILDDKYTRDNNGLADFEHLSQLWSHPPFEEEEGYPEELHPLFLRLMERFDLSYKVILDPDKQGNTSLIAQLVPDTRPETLPNWGEKPEAGDKQQVQICRIVDERGQFATAEGLFYKLIVRLHKYSLGRNNYQQSIHWQRGLMLDNDYNGRALLQHIGTDIKITVRAAYPERFLSYLTEEVKWLVESFWEGLRCNVMVACINPCGMNQPGQGLFEVQKLIESKKKNRHDFPCPISGCDEWQNIDQLLTNAPMISSSSQQIDLEKLQTMFEKLFQGQKDILKNINVSRIQNQKGFEKLSKRQEDILKGIRISLIQNQKLDKGQREILSKIDEQFASLIQMFTDEAKDGPRLFSLKPVDPKFFDRPKWISTKFQLTLWCEHSRQPLPALNPPESSKKGVYELNLSRKWLTKAAPFLNILFKTLSLVAPVAVAGTNLIMDDKTYAGVKEELDLGQKSLDFIAKGGLPMIDKMTESNAPDWSDGDPIMAKGGILRELHVLLKERDPRFGGLVRVQNKRREFLWVHEKFVDEY